MPRQYAAVQWQVELPALITLYRLNFTCAASAVLDARRCSPLTSHIQHPLSIVPTCCQRPAPCPAPPRLQVQWLSPFLMAVYDPVSETYQSLCRCMSGFTDAFYAAATERLMVRSGAKSLPACCRLARPAAAHTPASRAHDIMSSAQQPAGGAALVAQATRIPGPKAYYVTNEQPSVWFEPTEVWELRGADLTLSPVHKAAVGQLHQERGVGLRFPRCV